MKKLLCLSVVVGIVATSHASFEMALVAQTHTPSNGVASKKIGRWDPQNGVFLGYFGAGTVIGTAITIDPTQSNTVIDIYGSANAMNYQRFNYSTGENLGLTTVSLGGSNTVVDAQALSTGQMLVAGIIGGSNGARLLNANGTTARTYTLPAGATSALSIFQNSAGVTFILTQQPGTTSGSRYTLASYAANSGTIASSVVVADNTTGVYDNLIQSGNNVIVGSSFANVRRIFPVTGTSLGANISTGGWATQSDTFFAGHGNAYYSMGYDSSLNRVYLNTMSGTGSGTYTYFESTQYGAISDSAMVVAPEPMTMVGLGLGLAAVLRRRKNSTS
jgi:hypothetical protein